MQMAHGDTPALLWKPTLVEVAVGDIVSVYGVVQGVETGLQGGGRDMSRVEDIPPPNRSQVKHEHFWKV